MTKDKAIAELVRIWHSPYLDLSLKAGLAEAIDALKGEDGDLISRQDAIDALMRSYEIYEGATIRTDVARRDELSAMIARLKSLSSAEPKTGRDCTDFVRWLMDEVMDEENWQMNAVANGEIICRKLKKLGLLDVVDGYYVETQKTGEWIEVEVFPEVYDIEGVKSWGSEMQCDQCGFRFTAIEGHITQYNYCPNCGSYNGGEKYD